jgi:hypothetical protein
MNFGLVQSKEKIVEDTINSFIDQGKRIINLLILTIQWITLTYCVAGSFGFVIRMSKRKRISNPMEDYKLPECILPLDFKSHALKTFRLQT